MRKIIFLLFLFLISQKQVEAQIKEGKVESNVSVDTNIKGEGNVKTRIEVNVNGNKKIVESDKPGKIEVKVRNGSIDVKESSPSPKSEVLSPSSKQEKKDEQFISSIIKNIFDKLQKFFNNFL